MVGTYDGAMVRFYVNGVQQFATPRTGTFASDTTGLQIGAGSNDAAHTPAEAFNGRVDAVRVYNVALSASQVLALYQGALSADVVAPVVTSVTSPTLNGSYGAGSAIVLSVSFSEVVTVTGTPQLTLETGASDAAAPYTSGSGTATLTFAYTVGAGQTATDLDYVSVGALTLNGGTIRDAAGNAAMLMLPSPGAPGSLGANKTLVVDTAAPSVPTGLAVTPGAQTTMALSWTAATDNVGVTGYRIYRDGTAVGTSAGTSFQDTGLLASTTYSYTVTAVDAAGNQSAPSQAVSATTRRRGRHNRSCGWTSTRGLARWRPTARGTGTTERC